jgi:hypothetical protein
MENCTFSENEGMYGGAIAIDSSATLSTCGSSRAAGALAGGQGGAFCAVQCGAGCKRLAELLLNGGVGVALL